jgi:SAM-dependent methyltransferase
MTFWERGRFAIARALNLDLTFSQTSYGRFLDSHIARGIRWLDVGCGRQLIPEWAFPFEEQQRWAANTTLIGVDADPAILEHPLLKARAFALGGNLPFASESFDMVTANMVVEHLREPGSFLVDIKRVLRPGGRFLFHTPNYLHYLIFAASLTPEWLKSRIVWILERREESDRFAAYYRLNTQRAIRRAAREAGLEVESLRAVGSAGAFGRLGPIGWLECIPLKLVSVIDGGSMRSNLLVSLRKPAV